MAEPIQGGQFQANEETVDPQARIDRFDVEPETGIEPVTAALRKLCSTD